jgi:hypothetical protein
MNIGFSEISFEERDIFCGAWTFGQARSDPIGSIVPRYSKTCRKLDPRYRSDSYVWLDDQEMRTEILPVESESLNFWLTCDLRSNSELEK